MSQQQVIVSVLSDIREFSKGMNDVAQKAQSTFSKLGKLLVAGLALDKIGDWVGDVVGKFQGREDDLGNIGSAYGEKFQEGFNKFSFSLAGLGASSDEVAKLGSMITNTFKNAGLSGEQFKGTLVRILDIQGATGIEQEKIATAWDNAIRGRTAGMAKILGIDKKKLDSLIEEKMKTEGLTKAQATQAVLEERSAKYKGEAAKDAKTLGGQLEILRAIWDNFGQAIADKVMPYVIAFSEWATGEALPAMQKLGDVIGKSVVEGFNAVSDWYNSNRDWLNAIAVGLLTVATAWGIWTGAIQTWSAITKIAAAVQAAFNAVMALNPITIIVLAIAALVAGLIYFFTQTETGKALWASFTQALSDGWNWLVGVFNSAVAAIGQALQSAWAWIVDAWNKIIAFFKSIPGKISAVFSSAISWLLAAGKNILSGLFNGIKNIWTTVSSWFGQVRSKVTGFFGSAVSWLVNAGRSILSGAYNGIKNGWTTVSNWFNSVDNKIKGFFSGASSWLSNAGRNLLQGLWNGISDKVGWIYGKIRGMITSVINFIKGLFGIKSPSRVTAQIGQYLMQGMAKGINDNADLPMDAFSALRFESDLVMDTVRAGGTVYMINGVELNLTPEEGEIFENLARKVRVGV